MNLISFSIRTKGLHNFTRRLWTVFTRFGLTEVRTRKALLTIVETLCRYNTAPTFFIPAVVLRRHPALMMEISRRGAEVGIHGYAHNDFRLLSGAEQYKQTEQAISIFQRTNTPFQGFRNPYLGWTEESLEVFRALQFTYESNEAVLHDVVDRDSLPALLRAGYEKSLLLFQALPCNAYTLRPHFEDSLVRIPTSIPDDEMLFDRLRITNPEEIGRIWSRIVGRVYELGGVYTLNLHPERAIPCKPALDMLLSYAQSQPLPIWPTRLRDIAQWWKERILFRLQITAEAPRRWKVEAMCSSRATILARYLTVEDRPLSPWYGADMCVPSHSFVVSAKRCPCIGLSPRTPQKAFDFLLEQGYPTMVCPEDEAQKYAIFLDMPEGLGTTRLEQLRRRSELVQRIEELEAPLLHFGNWPEGRRMAVVISGDIDSVTVQDFFLRIFEVNQHV